ncbi:MAG: hypothetical protein ACTSPU_01745 [Promethearchaeota archaeon]
MVGSLLVYDVTRHESFSSIESKWLKDFKNFVKREGAYILIGNKIDLVEQRVVSKEEGENLAKKIGASAFIETSAKFGKNVEEAFKNLVYQILRNYGEKI